MHSRRLREELDEAIAEGWQIERETPDRVVLVRHSYGSLAIHAALAVLTAWWAFGLFNVIYGAYAYLNETERRVLREHSATTCAECGAAASPDAEYCRECGERLDRGVDRGPNESTTCPECDAVVSEGARFCSNCGTRLADVVEDVE